jgi:hypothetical protein
LFPFQTDPTERRSLLLIALAAVLVATAGMMISLLGTGGRFVLPLDDAYIHLQYARMAARGQLLVYTQGAGASGGMTSPLLVLLLAPQFLLGFSGTKTVLVSWLLGVALFTLTAVWLAQLVRRLTSNAYVPIAGVLFLGSGHFLWHFTSGMETGLYAALLVGLVLAAHAWWSAEARWAAPVLFCLAAILPLARPEGIVGIVSLALLLMLRRGERPRLSPVLLLACAVPFLLWLTILKMGTGDWRPAGMIVKSLSSAPYASEVEKLGFAAQNFAAIFNRYYFNVIPDDGWAAFKGTMYAPSFVPGFGILLLLGLGFAAGAELGKGRPASGLLLALLTVGALAAPCTSLFPFAHHQRYVVPGSVLGLVLVVMAIRRLCQLFQQLEDVARRGILIVAVITSAPSLAWWTAEHGRNGNDLYQLLRRATFGLQDSTAPLAITDAGILAFYTNRQVDDLVGLTTARYARATGHGYGATLEEMARTPHERRPTSLVTYRAWFDEDFPVGEEEWATAVPRTSIVWSNRLSSFRLPWAAIDQAAAPPVAVGHTLIGGVDVASLTDERTNGYEFETARHDLTTGLLGQHLAPSVRFVAEDSPTTGTLPLYLYEGGRIVRQESFELRTEGRLTDDLLLVARLAPVHRTGLARAGELRVRVVSQTTGFAAERVVMVPDEPATVRIPLGSILNEVGGNGRWRVEVLPLHGEDQWWISCRYWVYRQR